MAKKPQPNEDIVLLAKAPTAQEAHVWKQVLEDEEIECHVVGDFLDASLGSLDTITAELWVRRADLDRARAALEAHHQSRPLQEQAGEDDLDEDEKDV